MKRIIYFLPLILIFNFGCKEVFEKSLDDTKVLLMAPVDSLVSNDSIQIFYWQPLDSGTKYELQLVSPRFDSIVSFTADTTIQLNHFQALLAPKKYQWRVRAFNNSSTTTYTLPRTLTIY